MTAKGPTARPASEPRRSPQATATLAAAVLGFFVVTLDAVVVNIALPSIRADLGGGMTGLQWVVDGYTLMFATLLLSAGALSDRVGARRTFGAGIGLFVAASAACGLAPTIGALVAARFVQGAAAAVIMPSSMALISQAYPDPVRRARAVAVWAMGGAIASSCGPVLAGALTLVDWRTIFVINVPVGGLALALLARAQRSPRRPVPFDWAGQLTAVAAMGGLVYGAIEGGTDGFITFRVIIALVVAAAALAAFLLVQARGRHPMVPLEMFRAHNVPIAVAVGFAFIVGYYGLAFVMSLDLQQQRGLSPFGAGVAFLPMMVTGLILTPFSARIAERVGARWLVTGGLVVMAAGLVALAAVPAAPVWVLAALMVLVGLGGPLVMPPVTGVLLTSVPGHRAGTASGVFNTSRQAGGALAVAVFGALLASGDGFQQGLRVSLLIAAAVALAAAAAAAALRAPRAAAAGDGRVSAPAVGRTERQRPMSEPQGV